MAKKKQHDGPIKNRKENFSYKKWRQKHKKKFIFIRTCIFILLMLGILFYFVFKFFFINYRNLDYLTKLNETTHQISSLVDNIRTHYMVFSDEGDVSLERLIEVDAIPATLLSEDKKSLVNNYGGKIIIEPSQKLLNIKDNLKSATFKMSYQGLPKQVCVDLAMMDWGDEEKGLLAVAIGGVDLKTNIDTALEGIDKDEQKPAYKTFTDNKNQSRSIRQRNHYNMTVAKPNNPFMPTPFSRGSATSGCECGDKDTCTFALRYTIYSVDQINQIKKKSQDTAFSKLQRKRMR